MKRLVWKNKSNGQLCITIPISANIKEGDLVEVKRSAVKRITYSGVVGDLFHYGHLHSIEFAKSISDYNIVGVLTDKAVEEYRVKPIANLKERKAIISSLNCVDRVMVQNARDPTENLKKIHEEFPDAEIILVHGADLKYVHGSEYVKNIKGGVVQHPYYERLSTPKIIRSIIENQDKFKDIVDFASLIKEKGKADFEFEKGNKTIVSTKANTLMALGPLLEKSRIEKMIVFTISDWKNKKEDVVGKIKEEFSPGRIVVRSSAINEDTMDRSMAGCFESMLNVDSGNEKQIDDAVKRVIGSYKHKKLESSFNQVLVQSQTHDIVMSGVVFTRTLEKNSPYYTINYDDFSGESDSVTKGIAGKTMHLLRFAESEGLPENMSKLIAAVKEIESIVPGLGLDIEFAVDKNNEVVIFQVRPLTTSLKGNDEDSKIKERIGVLKKKVIGLSKKMQHLCGERTILADMPDWNPAEIIGDRPNHLDYSLYDYIITDSAWHEARTSQGYYNVNPAKLVVLVGNKPYVDVRNTFNSFTPASISQELRRKLVSFYMDKLEKNPELQDKVEFEVLYTCYDLNFDERAKELHENGFSEKEVDELKRALISLTNNLVVNSKEDISENLNALKEMERNREDVRKGRDMADDSVNKMLENAKFLLDDCRKNGTVQFSRLARLGFVGKIILKSLVKKGIIDDEIYYRFMNSVSTIAKEISSDFKRMSNMEMSKEEFICKYYHLRPGSYDITSMRYDANPELLNAVNLEFSDDKNEQFALDNASEERITNAFKQDGLKFDAKEFFEFVKCALEAREFSKFEFSKNLSDALELIATAGEHMGFTRQELAMLDVAELFSNAAGEKEMLTKTWKDSVSKKTDERKIDDKLVLPPVIFSEKELDIVRHYVPRPNYITNKKVKGRAVNLNMLDKGDMSKIEGSIVLLENGDPGYDWIFTRGIAGLITKYGGVASHMSIRCAEFGIPAAIGCGVLFDRLANSHAVELDCGFKRISALGAAE